MGFSDALYLVIFAFVFIVVILSSTFILNTVMASIGPKISPAVNTSVMDSWDQNLTFADDSFTAIWFILAAVSIGMTIFLGSHPIMLAVWVLFNITAFFVYDMLSDFLTVFLASDLNTGDMNDASAFVQGGMPKAIVIINVLMGAVLFGKRAMG